jgi:cytochrome c-type biogenesis protein
MSLFYSVGIGLPFVLLAAGFGWATRSVDAVKRHIRGFNLAGGALLILLGLLMVTGLWASVVTSIQEVFGNFVPAL